MGKELDARSDIYALGCVMYEVFSGSPPFDANSFYEMVRQHVDKEPPSLTMAKTKMFIPTTLKAIILKCLQKDPSQRYQNAEQLLKELSAVAINETVSA